MIYLFTSNSRGRYIEDALNVLALPRTYIYQFSYESTWMDPALNPATLPGKVAVVVLIDQQAQPPGGQTFYLLRKVTIVKADKDGDVFHIAFRLGDYVDWRALRPGASTNAILQAVPGVLLPPAKYIAAGQALIAPVAFAAESEYAEAWQSLVATLSQIPNLTDTLFYRVSRLKKVTNDAQAGVKSVSDLFLYQSGYEIDSDQFHQLELSFYRPTNANVLPSGLFLETKSEQALFSYAPAPLPINFRYDKREIDIVPKAVTQDIYTKVRFRVQGAPPQSPQASVDLLLKLAFPKLKFYGGFFTLLLAQGMIASPGIVAALNDPNASAVAPKAIAASAALLGTFLSAVTLFALFRTFPSGK
jgi:hypothetical protein